MEVLEAAGTKWNFLPFRPGLVGGHCIGVDPYYLTHKADMVGYHPQVILAGRRINDGMGKFVAEQTVKLLMRNGWQVKGARVDRARPHVQGELPRPAQFARDRRHPRARSRTAPTSLVHDPVADAGGGAARIRRRRSTPWERPAAGAQAIVAAVAHASSRRARSPTISAQLEPEGRRTSTSRASSTPRRCERGGVTVWRL